MKTSILLLAFSVVVHTSCKKSDEVTETNYVNNTSINKGMPEMYTQAGKITDSAIINSFLRRYNSNFQLRLDTIYTWNAQMVRRDTIELSIKNSVGTLTYRDPEFPSVNRTKVDVAFGGPSDATTLVVIDTAAVIVDNNPVPCETIRQNSKKVPLINLFCNYLDPSRKICYFRQEIPARSGADQFRIPIMNLFVSRNPPSSLACFYNVTLLNSFNTGVVSSLTPNDTIVVQQGEIVLERR